MNDSLSERRRRRRRRSFSTVALNCAPVTAQFDGTITAERNENARWDEKT